MAANVIIISGSQYERRSISQRTRDALAAKRARESDSAPPRALPLDITRRIIDERNNGNTFQAIADGLMADGVTTARGKTRWFPATIKAVYCSDNAAAIRRPGGASPVAAVRSRQLHRRAADQWPAYILACGVPVAVSGGLSPHGNGNDCHRIVVPVDGYVRVPRLLPSAPTPTVSNSVRAGGSGATFRPTAE